MTEEMVDVTIRAAICGEVAGPGYLARGPKV